MREKVLEKLDIRGARAARELATRIREVILRMAEEASEDRGASLTELRVLCADANQLLDRGALPPPSPRDCHERVTLPVPRPPTRSRRPPRPSGVTTIELPDGVANRALRKRSASR